MPPATRRRGAIFDHAGQSERLRVVEAALQDPSTWADPAKAHKLSLEKKRLDGVVPVLTQRGSDIQDATDLFALAREDQDFQTLIDLESDVERLSSILAELELRRMFNNPLDSGNCFIDIQAGAGGTEAQSFAAMLRRQYIKFAERKGFKAELTDEMPSEPGCIKNSTLRIEGDHAYGLLRTETGVHRLTRISPYDSRGRLHTSFAAVFVYPEVADDVEIDINPADVRVDTFRANGAGGQHIQKTDSAVRMTHMPTGIVVQCQDSRSQHENREVAWRRLRSRLYDREMRLRQEEKQKLEDAKPEVGWAHQIRSYSLDQSRVKDLRTGVETRQAQKVFDGDLDAFIEASLRQGV